MNPARKGTALKIDIRLALSSLGRDGSTKGKRIAELEAMLADLRREQIDRGIIKPRAA